MTPREQQLDRLRKSLAEHLRAFESSLDGCSRNNITVQSSWVALRDCLEAVLVLMEKDGSNERSEIDLATALDRLEAKAAKRRTKKPVRAKDCVGCGSLLLEEFLDAGMCDRCQQEATP